MKNRIRTILRLTFLVAFLSCGVFGAVSVYQKVTTDKAAEREYESIREEVFGGETAAAETVEDPGGTTAVVHPYPEGLKKLMQENPDVKGWIQVDGTHINYPVVSHGDEYQYFLHKDIYGNYSFAGSIFVDCIQDINKPAFHCLYGHHMKNSTMFRDVERFLDKDYFDAHQSMRIFTKDRVIELEPVICYHRPEDTELRKVFDDPADAAEFLSERAERVLEPGNYFLLITCSYFTHNARTYLITREKT